MAEGIRCNTSGNLRNISKVTGADVFCGEGFDKRDILIDEQRIVGVNTSVDGAVLDASGCFAIPGLVDLHFHGAAGSDISDGSIDGLHTIANYEASRGITTICPATMTLSEEQLTKAAHSAAQFFANEDESYLAGIHMEGPYISPSKIGAQNPAYVRSPDIDEFARLQKAANNKFKIVDIAPEVSGAYDFIKAYGQDVRISIAHTCTDYDVAAGAFDLGARHITHLFNAMDPMHHRTPGPIPAALERDFVTAEIIADGIHIHPAMVRLAFSAFGDDRMILVSDTLRAAGLKDGVYDLGGQDVTVKGFEARIENGALAGSVSDLMRCFYVAVTQMNIPLVSAIKAASVNPARALGLSEERGSLEPGHIADVVLLDKETLEISHIILRGKLLK